jgi:hypothetical protein
MAKFLFLPRVDPHSFFEKEASISKMPDDEKNWPAHILSVLHEQLPFLSNFSVNIMIQRMEPEAGFAFGYAMILGKSDPRVAAESKNPENSIRIPLIVADRQLQPFHTFELKGQVMPLTSDRVEAAMMNPVIFDGPATRPRAQKSLVDQLYPPFQQRGGFGMTNTGTNQGGISKVSSAPNIDNLSPKELKNLQERAELKSSQAGDEAAKNRTNTQKGKDAVRSSVIPVTAGALLDAAKSGISGGGSAKDRGTRALAGLSRGALLGAGISGANIAFQEGSRKKREDRRKALGMTTKQSSAPLIKEALARLDFSPNRRIPSSMVMGKSKVNVAPGVTPMSIHFFPVMGTKFVVGVDAKLAKKLGKMKDQNQIRRALMRPMKAEIRAARSKRPSPGMFMLFVKGKKGYIY